MPVSFEELKGKIPKKVGKYVGLEDNNFLVAVDEERTFILSPTAFYVWNLCSGEESVSELADKILKEISESGEKLTKEELKEPLALILTQLEEVGLITWIEQ